MHENRPESAPAQTWAVGALCRAVADSLQLGFGVVTVVGEISGWSRAGSGHCYFSLRDDAGQLRCAMFRRAAAALRFTVSDGDCVELVGRLSVYEARGDLQLVVESMRPFGSGRRWEQFARLKQQLEQEGLFASANKKPLPAHPRCIGVVTSLKAAALHDVVTTLQRRAPHIPVVVAAAAVQGMEAPTALMRALQSLYIGPRNDLRPDVILLVRGGGAMDDLWAFNDEALVRMLATRPVPVVTGVGHETDFTLVDFVADVRAPTPTAAAELVAAPIDALHSELDRLARLLHEAAWRRLERSSQRLDWVCSRLGRPAASMQRQLGRMQELEQGLSRSLAQKVHMACTRVALLATRMRSRGEHQLVVHRACLDNLGARLALLDPALVLGRGYAWLALESGATLSRVGQATPGLRVRASLTDGTVDLVVAHPTRN